MQQGSANSLTRGRTRAPGKSAPSFTLPPASCYFQYSPPGVAELADAADSKSAGDHSPCGFDSLLRDHLFPTHVQAVFPHWPKGSWIWSCQMKVLSCWRCKAEVAMLEDDEFNRVSSLLNTGTEGSARERMFGPPQREYERIAGLREANPNAIYHHVSSMYGPPCANCGKPLRTPRAQICGFCMTPRRFEAKS